jgi:hypothetical protein
MAVIRREHRESSHSRPHLHDHWLNMRRVAKPFTVEIKKRGGRKREAADAPTARNDAIAPVVEPMVGRDIRFRDAESLFRGGETEPGFREETQPAPAPSDEPKTPPRRILPDLIAEAALSQASLAAMPAPRRRGRPPKIRTGEAIPRLAKRGRKPPSFSPETLSYFDLAEDEPETEPTVVVPAVLYLAASARRRAARATDNLPRAERWKRRLPKVCW